MYKVWMGEGKKKEKIEEKDGVGEQHKHFEKQTLCTLRYLP